MIFDNKDVIPEEDHQSFRICLEHLLARAVAAEREACAARVEQEATRLADECRERGLRWTLAQKHITFARDILWLMAKALRERS